MAELPKRIQDEIDKIVAAEGFELVNIDYRPAGRGHLLRVDIDKEGGITLGDCQLVSEQLSTWLDVDDSIPSEYELQVSSPGLDRKFYKPSDYQKFLGRLVRVRTAVPVRGLHVVIGRLESFDGQRIIVIDPKSKKATAYEIDLSDIRETRLEVEF